jgi:hypothetical protein
VIWSRREGPWKYLNGKIRIKRVDIWLRNKIEIGWRNVTPIFKEQMECIILCAPRDQSHIRWQI